MEQNKRFKRCNACARDIHRSSFAQHFRTNDELLKSSNKLKCETCKLVIISVPGFQKHLFSGEHFARVRKTT